jgi:hypothetical protein
VPIEPESPIQKAARDTWDQVQRTMFEYEKRPPAGRSDIVHKALEKVRNVQALIGRKNGSNAFRLQLLDLAAFLIYAASLVGDGKISIE